MRVTGGEAKGRRLLCPAAGGTRPTPAKVREALFAILGPPVGAVLDLFAGSGALGIESLSRGAARATFVERAPAALSCLRQNLAWCRARARLLPGDARRRVAQLAGERGQFSLIFVDPPYDGGLAAWALTALADAGLVAAGGTVLVERASHAESLPAPPGLARQWQRAWGDTAVVAYSGVDLPGLPCKA